MASGRCPDGPAMPRRLRPLPLRVRNSPEGQEPPAGQEGRGGGGGRSAAREGFGEVVSRWGREALGPGMPDAADAAGDLHEQGLGEMGGEAALPGAQLGGEVGGGGAVVGVLAEAAGQDREQGRRDSGEVGVGVADAVDEVGVLSGAEGPVAGGCVGEDAA